MRRPPLAVPVALLCAALAVAGCGRDSERSSAPRPIGVKGSTDKAAADLGFPLFATKNTVRVAG
jgi:hypothetical protein